MVDQATLVTFTATASGLLCGECGVEHRDWEMVRTSRFDDGYNAGIVDVWECLWRCRTMEGVRS